MRVRVFAAVVCVASAAWLAGACATGTLPTEGDASCATCGSDASSGGDGNVKPGPDGACPSGEQACSGDAGALCVDTKTDPAHCGSCTNACIPQLEGCDGGACVSLCGAKSLCIPDAGGDAGAPHCADLQTDSNDCGKCGVTCGGDASCVQGVCDCGHDTKTFTYSGAMETWVVPCGITSVTITAWGAQGANAQDVLSSGHTAGLGGTASGTLAVTPGATLYVNVGGAGTTAGAGGFNGGGAGGSSTAGSGCAGGPAGGGGGMSDVRLGGTALTNIVIAAAGGGGSGRDYCNGSCVPCGCGGGNGGGGGATGTNGGPASNCGYGYPGSGVNGGQGGTQSAGGSGGTGDGAGTSGSPGVQGTGGAGASGSYDVAGGGGGGGYYGGGGGGGAGSGSGVGGGGGAGGASYVGGVTSGTTSSGVQSGDGKITITW